MKAFGVIGGTCPSSVKNGLYAKPTDINLFLIRTDSADKS
jgi:hypothetical protein